MEDLVRPIEVGPQRCLNNIQEHLEDSVLREGTHISKRIFKGTANFIPLRTSLPFAPAFVGRESRAETLNEQRCKVRFCEENLPNYRTRVDRNKLTAIPIYPLSTSTSFQVKAVVTTKRFSGSSATRFENTACNASSNRSFRS